MHTLSHDVAAAHDGLSLGIPQVSSPFVQGDGLGIILPDADAVLVGEAEGIFALGIVLLSRLAVPGVGLDRILSALRCR